MVEIDLLFKNRYEIGKKIEDFMDEKGLTKKNLCEMSGISRPTLDKIITGQIQSITTFEKHLEKVCSAMQLTLDDLVHQKTRTKIIRNRLRMEKQRISEITGITKDRLNEIENGSEATTEEYRDIALVMGTSVRVLKGEDYFERTVYGLDSMLQAGESEPDEGISAFWGHIGLLLCGSDEYVWFPISGSARKKIYQNMDQKKMVISCMNNRVILLNMEFVRDICLVDEACDEPAGINWDTDVSNGEIPPVVFEALSDYFDDKADMSECFGRYMDEIVNHYEWDDDVIITENYETKVCLKDGKQLCFDVEFGRYENISEIIDLIYAYDEENIDTGMLYFEDLSGAEHILNLDQTAMIVMPLISLEESIREFNDEL